MVGKLKYATYLRLLLGAAPGYNALVFPLRLGGRRRLKGAAGCHHNLRLLFLVRRLGLFCPILMLRYVSIAIHHDNLIG
jgi:hypothetical protein